MSQGIRAALKLNAEYNSSLDRLSRAIASGGKRYKELRFLVIDDIPTVRSTLQVCLQALGASQIDFAQSHWDAVHKIKQRMPDVILCDYNLGEGRNGQQVLEELRREGLLSEGVVFLMVTAETQYPQVVAAVELAPDDYILKPFTADLLNARLGQLILKKAFFRPYYEEVITKRYDKAVEVLNDLLVKPECRPYRFDCMRLIAETLLRSGAWDAAKEKFEELIDLGDFPWAKLGLARCLQKEGETREAMGQCQAAIDQVPVYTNAYDLKADLHAELGEFEQARRVAHDALQVSPFNFDRKRRIVDYSVKLGDHAMAREMLDSMRRNPSDAERIDVQDQLAQVRVELASGQLTAARDELANIRLNPRASFDEQVSLVCLRYLADPERDATEFNRMRKRIAFTPLDVNASVDVVRACLAMPDIQVAQMVAINVLSGPQRRAAFPLLNELFTLADKKPLFQKIKHTAAENWLQASEGHGAS